MTGKRHCHHSPIPVRLALALILSITNCLAVDWIQAGVNTKESVWGCKGRLQFAIHPSGFTWREGGPRGLIRIGYPTLPEGAYDLINFIAVEPVVGKTRGLSELEKSSTDGEQGKVFRAGNSSVSSLGDGIEELSVPLRIERFNNGAHVRLKLSQRSDRPDELRITVEAEADSAPMESCILTATMGNKARTRLLWLREGPISSLKIFGDYKDAHFTRHEFFPLGRMSRTASGDPLVSMTTDEDNPADSNKSISRGWQYRGMKVTQYWRKPASDVQDSMRCAVNGRFMYWMSQNPIPGGLAYENFEFVEPFRTGQQFIFGVTTRTHEELLK